MAPTIWYCQNFLTGLILWFISQKVDFWPFWGGNQFFPLSTDKFCYILTTQASTSMVEVLKWSLDYLEQVTTNINSLWQFNHVISYPSLSSTCTFLMHWCPFLSNFWPYILNARSYRHKFGTKSCILSSRIRINNFKNSNTSINVSKRPKTIIFRHLCPQRDEKLTSQFAQKSENCSKKCFWVLTYAPTNILWWKKYI